MITFDSYMFLNDEEFPVTVTANVSQEQEEVQHPFPQTYWVVDDLTCTDPDGKPVSVPADQYEYLCDEVLEQQGLQSESAMIEKSEAYWEALS